ncbi:MAG TPA: glycoside hydrolase family 95 protein, partial [Flavisolibacter sp.]
MVIARRSLLNTAGRLNGLLASYLTSKQNFMMKGLFLSAAIIFCTTAVAQKPLTLWYNKPASTWTEALPVGNGTIGAMVFGGATEELLQLNEATLWSGGPVKSGINPASPQYLQPLREALFAGDYKKADAMAHRMQGLYSESYMPLGNVKILQSFTGSPTAYYRDLNIQDAVATTTFAVNGVQYKREIFSSAPDKAIVVRISADKSKQLNLTIAAGSQLRHAVSTSKDVLVIKGKAPSHVEPSYYNPKRELIVYGDTTGCRGMRFAVMIKPVVRDGKLFTDTAGIHITDASEVVLYVTAATSFNGYDKCPDKEGKDELRIATTNLLNASGKTYNTILRSHLADFQRYFNRVSLTLNKDEKSKANIPTDERLEAYTKGEADAGLEALYFQYGRYLLVSSSRTANAPANLQGIWNKEMRPPWSSNYTTNINVQMNYWPAESTNLSE